MFNKLKIKDMEYFIIKRNEQYIAGTIKTDATEVANVLANIPAEAREGTRIEKVTEVDLMNTLMTTIGNMAQENEILKQRVAEVEKYINELKERE